VWTALDWAKKNCPSYITNATGPARTKKVPGGWVNNASIVYYFSDEQDAVFFALKWT
jgi:hypothetical protein